MAKETATETPSEDVAPTEVVEQTEGFKGTAPVENIDDTDGDVEDVLSDEFGELALEMLEDDGEVEPDQEEPKVEKEPKVPEVKAEEEAAETKPDEPEVTKETPKDEGEELSQEPEPEPTLSVEEQQVADKAAQDAAREARSTLVDQIAESVTFTEDEIERLKTEPETVLPKLVANLYVDVHNAVMQNLQAQMPQMIQQVTQQQKTQDASTKAFQDSWEKIDLGNKDHMAVVGRLGSTYRQMNPKASQEQFIREVGAQAMIALKIPLTAEMGYVEAAEEPAAAPHKPVGTSGASPVPKAVPDNPFESLAEEFLEDDRS